MPAGLPVSRTIIVTGLLLVTTFLAVNLFGKLVLGGSNFGLIRDVLTINSGEDSWLPLKAAYKEFFRIPSGRIYETIFFERHVKFQYPPSSLLPFHLAAGLGIDPSPGALAWINLAFLLIQAGCVGALFAILYRQHVGDVPADAVTGGAIVFLLCLTFYPAIKPFSLGQVQTWINALFALACVTMVVGRPLVAGICVGAICWMKPQMGLLALWALVRGQREFLIGWLIAFVPAQLAALWVFGLQNHIDYVAVLRFLSQHGEAFYPNQSMNGLLHRLLGNGEAHVWQPEGFPPFHRMVYFGTLISSLLLLLVALRKRTATPPIVDFAIAGLAFTMASPIAWEHHYGILPSLFAIALALWMAEPESTRKRRMGYALLACYIFSANLISIGALHIRSPFNIVQSYLFIAALGLLWVLETYARERRPEPGAMPHGG